MVTENLLQNIFTKQSI